MERGRRQSKKLKRQRNLVGSVSVCVQRKQRSLIRFVILYILLPRGKRKRKRKGKGKPLLIDSHGRRRW